MLVKANRVGGVYMWTEDKIINGILDVDETLPWVRKALRDRDIVRVKKDGSFLMKAPPGDGPVNLDTVFMPLLDDFPCDDDRIDSDFEDRSPECRPKVLDEYSVKEIRCLYADGVSVARLKETYGVSRSTIYGVTSKKTWDWVYDFDDMDVGRLRKSMGL